jgi:ribose transport system substrate-binding protein
METTMRWMIVAWLAGVMISTATGTEAADRTIAVFTKNTTNPAYEAFRIAADQVGRAAGVRVVHYVPKQPDNVIPVDDVAMIAPVNKLNDAGIPIVLASNPLPGRFVTYVGANDEEIGYREARYLFDKLGGKGRIVIVEGTKAAPTNRERLRGYQRALADYPGITVLASGSGNYQQSDAKALMATFLAAHAEIDAVLSANDSMALGVLEALKAGNRTAIVIGINGILPAVKQIEGGKLLASVDFNMFKIGCAATRAAVRHLDREPLPDKVILPAEIIDRTNYRAWLVPVTERSCPDWSEFVPK